MPRLLAHLLLLLYAGIFLHCQPRPALVAGSGYVLGASQQQQPRSGQCRKKLTIVQAASGAENTRLASAKLPLPHLALGSEFAAWYFRQLLPVEKSAVAPARGPDTGPGQVFANHPNKAPPVRFS